MRSADLAAAIVAAGEGLDAWLAESASRYGVPPQLYRVHGILCATRGHVDARRWQPSPDGRRLWCIPVRTWGEPSSGAPQLAVAHGDMVDVLALDPQRPAAWAVARGMAAWLGCAARQDWMPEPVLIHRTPLGWLRSRCRGLVLLAHDARAAQQVLLQLRHVVGEDVDHGRELRAIVETPIAGPQISVATVPARAA